MAPTQRYARVSDDEDVGMLSAQTSRTPEWAEKTSKSDSTPWWKYAAAAGVFIALLIPAVGYTSSVMLERKVALALSDAQTTPSTTGSANPATSQAADHTTTEHEHDADEGVELELSNGTTIIAGNPYGGKTFEIHDCGSNADEARAKGCSYDVMMQEWTPPECIDWTLAEKFLKNGNWTWYADAGAQRTYTPEEIALGNHDVVYVDQSYHRHHCIFTWERLVRAMRTQRPLVEKLVDYDHVMHCRMNTLKTFEEGAKPVRGVVAPTAFTSCASYDVWLQNLPKNKHSSIEKLKREISEWI